MQTLATLINESKKRGEKRCDCVQARYHIFRDRYPAKTRDVIIKDGPVS